MRPATADADHIAVAELRALLDALAHSPHWEASLPVQATGTALTWWPGWLA